jgi:hypothetical protein
MKKIFLAAAILLAQAAFAQVHEADKLYTDQKYASENKDTIAWIKNATINLGGNQTFLHNWAAGGELASLILNGRIDANALRYYKRHIWSNNLLMAYGVQSNYSTNFDPRKIDDRIDFTSKYGYRLAPESNWYITGLLNARTQFTKGYTNYDMDNWRDSSTSNFLSPLYLMVSPGIEYRRGEVFSVFFSPVAARMTFVNRFYTLQSEQGAYGVKYGETTRTELGAYLSARYTKEITKALIWKSRLDLYSNYLAKDVKNDLGEVVKKDNPGNIDIMFDNILTYQFLKYFNVGFTLTAIYDNDIPYKATYDNNGNQIKEPIGRLGWWQVRQGFTLGFVYNF